MLFDGKLMADIEAGTGSLAQGHPLAFLSRGSGSTRQEFESQSITLSENLTLPRTRLSQTGSRSAVVGVACFLAVILALPTTHGI